jgi:hypothetical protein
MPERQNASKQKRRRLSRTQHAQPTERAREVGAPANPSHDNPDASTPAAGIASEASSGGYGPSAGGEPGATFESRDRSRAQDRGGTATRFDTGAGRGAAEDAGVRLGIGLGGVSEIRGGSTGDRDLSGRHGSELDALEDIVESDDTTVGPGSDVGAIGVVSVSGKDRSTSTGFGHGGDVDVADLGRGAGVIDTTRDPIGGTGDEDNGMDATDGMVQGEVGAQAERDLTKLLGEHIHNRRDPADMRLQQGLTELIEEDDDEEEDEALGNHRR